MLRTHLLAELFTIARPLGTLWLSAVLNAHRADTLQDLSNDEIRAILAKQLAT